MILEVVRCEMCGRPTALYPSERKTLDDYPSLTIACEACVERCRTDLLYPDRKRLSSASGSAH